MSKIKYEECQHVWEFLIDADKSGGPNNKPWVSFFRCEGGCSSVINFLEKCALDEILLQGSSLKIQESHTRNGMIANIIAAGLMLIASIVLLYGEGVLR